MSKIFIDYEDLLDYINSLLGYTANLTREETLKQIKGYMRVMEKYALSDEVVNRLFEKPLKETPMDRDEAFINKVLRGEDTGSNDLSLTGDWDNDLHNIEVRWD